MRTGYEDGAVLEPARTGIEVELGLSGVQHVAAHAGFHVALHEDPVGSGIVAGKVGFHVVVAALKQDAARSFHDDAVVDALQLIGLERPRHLALRTDGFLRIAEAKAGGSRRGTETADHRGERQQGASQERRFRSMKKHGISRLQDRKREGKGIGQR